MSTDTTAADTSQSVAGAPVHARGLIKVFDQGKTRFHALGPVDLDIAAGEFVAWSAPAGAARAR